MPHTMKFELDNIQILDPRRRVQIAGIGPSMTFYFKGQGEDRGRMLLEQCSEDYLQHFGKYIHKSETYCERWRKTKKQTLEEFLKKKHCMDMSFAIHHGGSKDPEAFSHFNFLGDSPDRVDFEKRHSLNVIIANVPVAALAEQGENSFIKWMLRWIEWLEPVHAYAGFGIHFPYYASPNDLKVLYPYLMRFPGLDLDLPIHFDKDNILSEHVKGAHWLNFLNRRHIECLGGMERLGEDLGQGFELLEIGGGVLVQAGPAPQLGDVNQGIYPIYYYRLGKVLAPIRYKDVVSRNYINPPNEEDDIPATQAWLARFDEGVPDHAE